MTLIFELDLYRIKMNYSSMTVTWVKGNLVQKSGHTDTHTTYPQVYLDHVVENWLKSWYAVTFEHAAEQRFPRSAEVNTASDLNKIPPIHGVGALSKVDVAQRIRLYTIITSHWHKRILSLTADTGWKIKSMKQISFCAIQSVWWMLFNQAYSEYKHSLIFRVRRNETRAPIANPPNSTQLEGHAYHSPS